MLIPFEAKDTDFVLEFGANYIRFYNEHNIVKDGDYPYEIETPYSDEEVEELQYIQNGDYLYLFHKNHPIKYVAMIDKTDWLFANFVLKNGPWEHMNTSNTTLVISETTGDITITSSDDLFSENDVGRLIRITCVNSQKTAWQAEKSGITQGQVLYSDGKYYEAQSAGTTGLVKPVHTEGVVSDGSILFKYLHSGYGVAQILSYTSGTSVTATVLDRFPDELKTNSSAYWELGLIHSGMEYPMCGTFYRGRFCFMYNDNGIPTVCMSNSDDYDNFADKEHGQVLATNSITIPVTGIKRNEPCWLVSADVLFVGTSSAEYYIDSASSAEALAPDNVKIQQISSIGSLPIPPVKIGAHTIFVTKSGTSIRDIIYSFSTDAYDPIELSLYGKHLLSSGIKGMTYQEYPDKIIWFAVKDGRLIGLTFSSEQQVNAMHQHTLGGSVENITSIHNYHNKLDELWLLVERTAGGEIHYCIEWMDNGYPVIYPDEICEITDLQEKEQEESDYMKDGSFYVDCGSIIETNPYTGIHGNVYCMTSNMYKNITMFDENRNTETSTKTISAEDNVIPYNTDIYKNNQAGFSAQFYFTAGDSSDYTINLDDSLKGRELRVYQFTNTATGGRIAIILHDAIIDSNTVSFSLNLPDGATITSIKITIVDVITATTTEVTGLNYLEDNKVAILSNGAEQDKQVVTDGKIIIANKPQVVTVGLPIESEYVPQTIYIQANNGSGVGDLQRIDHITLMLWRSLGGKVGNSLDKLQDIYYRKTDAAMGESTSLYTGNKEIPVDMRTSFIKEKGATVLIYNDSVFPMNILAIAPHFSTSGNGK